MGKSHLAGNINYSIYELWWYIKKKLGLTIPLMFFLENISGIFITMIFYPYIKYFFSV